MDAINTAFQTEGHFSSEKELQSAVCHVLASRGSCERECDAEFGPAYVSAQFPPDIPPIDICKKKGCRKIDLLATLNSEPVAIELKFSRLSDWKGSIGGKPLSIRKRSDVVEYGFLKDIHRMERLTQVTLNTNKKCVDPQYRVCALVTNHPFETNSKTRHERMRLCPRQLRAGHLVQYNELTASGKPISMNTLWESYPPFCLAHSYEIAWSDVKGDSRDRVHADDETRSYPQFKFLAVDVSFVGTRYPSRS